MTTIDANTLYYLFSTISQTLAAAFAFVSAFVLFRNQKSADFITNGIEGMKFHCMQDGLAIEYSWLVRLNFLSQYNKMHIHIDQIIQVFTSKGNIGIEIAENLGTEIRKLIELNKNFLFLLWLTLPTLIISTTLIIFSPTLIENPTVCLIIVISIIALLVVNIGLIGRLLYKSI